MQGILRRETLDFSCWDLDGFCWQEEVLVIRRAEIYLKERRDQKPLMVIKEGGAEVGGFKLIIWKEER